MNGPYISPFGDVISSALSVGDAPHAYHDLKENFRLEIGQIQQIYAIDSTNNSPNGISAVFCVYDVLIQKPNGAMEVIPRCRALQPFYGGGLNNFSEILPTDPGPLAKDTTTDQTLKRGHWVLIGFISGQKDSGVILGGMPHPNSVAVKRRPTSDKGTYFETEIQGLNVKISNDGSFNLAFNGPRKDDGSLVDPTIGPTQFQIDATGNILVSTNEQQSIRIDRTAKSITITGGKNTVVLDQSSNAITITCDQATINTKKDATINAKGNANIIGAKGINLSKSEGSASEPFILGNKFVSFMQDLIQAIAQIQCMTTGLGAPTTPPMNAASITAMSSKLNSLLSSLIMGEK